MAHSNYRVVIERLPVADGGGYVAYVRDLPGCASDGSTLEEAAVNIQDAIACWIEAATELGRPVPQPSPQRAFA